MTLTEAALELGVDSSTLRHQIANGRLRAVKLGPVWTVTPREVERYRATNLGRPGRMVATDPRRRGRRARAAAAAT